ncbi:copper homeostasis protein CutC [Lentzea flava]|uniref:Copper homeostasis protein cutC homolog n=1 Tax=Lentzea flava TaxID=103732 RepID=A0ABQ2UPY7_9PSEU|nr:copper homeostasis protein CutC [Lentzea flava]MCP2200161.1 copper homeostasis protein [Lentzea flava]GGU46501.1 copper homeostasis protein [Lentzea flava]
MPILEVIALDVRDAEAAQEGGAHRLELVADMASDGLTPSIATLKEVRQATDLPIRVMLRDARGFAPGNLKQLRRQAWELREAGATEFVLGFLDAEGEIDEGVTLNLVAELEGCAWTFHRALDNSNDVFRSWATVQALGCDTVLAAGSPKGVEDGIENLKKLVTQAPPALLVGGGLQQRHVGELLAAGVTGFHVGSAVRPGGWDEPVAAASVREWVNRLV